MKTNQKALFLAAIFCMSSLTPCMYAGYEWIENTKTKLSSLLKRDTWETRLKSVKENLRHPVKYVQKGKTEALIATGVVVVCVLGVAGTVKYLRKDKKNN